MPQAVEGVLLTSAIVREAYAFKERVELVGEGDDLVARRHGEQEIIGLHIGPAFTDPVDDLLGIDVRHDNARTGLPANMELHVLPAVGIGDGFNVPST